MNLGLLALLAVVALLLFFVRERFEATSNVKDPSTWDTNEIERIKGMVSSPNTFTETEIRDIVGGFWSYSIPDIAGDPRNQQLKGWKNETLQITIGDINKYLDLKGVSTDKQPQFRELLKAYYIDQGQPLFQQARQGAEVSTTDKATTSSVTPVSRPLTTDPTLRMNVASYTGIPVNDPKLNIYITKIQEFYDKVYLPNKNPPTQIQISSFVRDIPKTDIPEYTRSGLESVIDYWFTQSQTVPELLEGVPQPRVEPVKTSGGDGGAGPIDIVVPGYTQGRIGEGPGGFAGNVAKPSQKIFGPLYSGMGESVGGGKGDTSKINKYPEILGGFPSNPDLNKFDLPSSGSLGTNENSQFLPYSRTPGDQDGAYMNRIGNTGLSTVQGSKTDPVPFLTDFSAFFR